MFKTRIVRGCCKLQFNLTQSESSRGQIVKFGDYKSKDFEKFHAAYLSVFKFIWKQMEKFYIVSGEPSDKNFIDFISLHFPETKVKEIAKFKNLEFQAEEQCEMRKRTSLWGYREMAKSNSMFMPII